jgi:hypothetical protein
MHFVVGFGLSVGLNIRASSNASLGFRRSQALGPIDYGGWFIGVVRNLCP